MDQRTINIFETDKGWRIVGPATPGGATEVRDRATAVKALRFIKKQDLQAGKNTMTVINWHPRTWVGQVVVKALQEQQ